MNEFYKGNERLGAYIKDALDRGATWAEKWSRRPWLPWQREGGLTAVYMSEDGQRVQAGRGAPEWAEWRALLNQPPAAGDDLAATMLNTPDGDKAVIRSKPSLGPGAAKELCMQVDLGARVVRGWGGLYSPSGVAAAYVDDTGERLAILLDSEPPAWARAALWIDGVDYYALFDFRDPAVVRSEGPPRLPRKVTGPGMPHNLILMGDWSRIEPKEAAQVLAVSGDGKRAAAYSRSAAGAPAWAEWFREAWFHVPLSAPRVIDLSDDETTRSDPIRGVHERRR